MRYTRAFFVAAALAVTAPLVACADVEGQYAAPQSPGSAPTASSDVGSRDESDTESSPPATKKATPATKRTAPAESEPAGENTKAKAKSKATSDLSGIRITDIRVGKGVLIDVADDGADRFLEVGESGVDFTGTGRKDTTMMSLHPAAVSAPDRVVIKPSFWNEDLGEGYCVADTIDAELELETCKPGKASQIWRVVLAGDSGLFELHGQYGAIGVQNGRITASGDGSTALQVLPYAPE